MLQALKVGLIIERTNKKNLVALLAVIVVVIGCMLFIKAQSIGEAIIEKKGDYYHAQAILSKFQIKDASEGGDGSDLYKNLTRQKSLIALQIANLTLENYPKYYETSLQLAKLRKDAFAMDDYEKVANLLPSKLQNDLHFIYHERMARITDNEFNQLTQYIPFLLFFFTIVGSGWYLFISFYTSSLLLDDYEHASIIKGFPVQFSYYILSKCFISFFYVLTFIALIFISATPLLKNGSRYHKDYVAVYFGNNALLTDLQYIALCIGYMLIISIFAMLLSIILNVLLKNMYLTLFVHFILFFLPIIFPQLISAIPFNPFNFMNFNSILNGMPTDLANPVTITMNDGVIVFVVSICIMLLIIKFFFSAGKITRA